MSARTPDASGPAESPRRAFVTWLGGVSLVAGAAGLLAALARSVVPEVLYEPARRFPVGRPSDFAPACVTF